MGLTCDVRHDGGTALQDERRVPAKEVLAKLRVAAVPEGAGVGQVVHPFLSHLAQLREKRHTECGGSTVSATSARLILAPSRLDTLPRNPAKTHLRHTPDY